MRYDKPIVMDLGAGARAAGQSPEACMPGGAVGPVLCFAGSGDAACYVGTDGSEYAGDCIPGGAATGNYSCLPGGVADWECAGGSDPAAPGPCTSGPAVL